MHRFFPVHARIFVFFFFPPSLPMHLVRLVFVLCLLSPVRQPSAVCFAKTLVPPPDFHYIAPFLVLPQIPPSLSSTCACVVGTLRFSSGCSTPSYMYVPLAILGLASGMSDASHALHGVYLARLPPHPPHDKPSSDELLLLLFLDSAHALRSDSYCAVSLLRGLLCAVA